MVYRGHVISVVCFLHNLLWCWLFTVVSHWFWPYSWPFQKQNGRQKRESTFCFDNWLCLCHHSRPGTKQRKFLEVRKILSSFVCLSVISIFFYSNFLHGDQRLYVHMSTGAECTFGLLWTLGWCSMCIVFKMLYKLEVFILCSYNFNV